MKISFVFPPPWAPWAPSYGMALLAGACRGAGHDFKGFDLNIDLYRAVDSETRESWADASAPAWNDTAFLDQLLIQHDKFLLQYVDTILDGNPDLVAISVQSASTKFALRFAKIIKEKRKNIFILLGGPDCFPSESGLRILEEECVDAICTGEGDHVLPLYLEGLAQNNMLPVESKGFAHRRLDGTIFDGGQPDAILDLDGLPFADYSNIDFSRYTLNNRVCMMTSRGCILRCSYCSEGANFLRYRYRSAESLFREVNQHVEMLYKASGQRPFINFSDSLINGRPEVLAQFCNLVINRGLSFSWGGMALLRKEMTTDLLALMQQAGWHEVMWGLESGSEGTLALMRKKLFNPEMAERIIRDTAELGIKQYTNIIVGFPGETDQQFAETEAFLKKVAPYFESIGLPMMEIRKNTHVYDAHHKFNVRDPDRSIDWETVDGSNTLQTRTVRRQKLLDIVEGKLFDQGRYSGNPDGSRNKVWSKIGGFLKQAVTQPRSGFKLGRLGWKVFKDEGVAGIKRRLLG